jgi:hypothetical protein
MSISELEKELSAFIDYICSCVIKNVNTPGGIVLVKGGKAVNEYLEKNENIPSYDWDTTYYGPNNICDVICTNYANEMQRIYDNFMPVAKLTITAAVKYVYRIKQKIESTINVTFSSGSRKSKISDVGLSFVNMNIGGYEPITLVEMTFTQADASMIAILQSAQKCKISLPNHILDNKRHFISLDILIDDLQEITKPSSSYPKKDKAKKRLIALQNAVKANKLNCYVRPNCQDRVVYDATGIDPGFKSWKNISNDFIRRDHKIINDNKSIFNVVISYTNIYDINKSLILAYYFKDESLISKQHRLERDRFDAAFDFHTAQGIVKFTPPVKVFRLTRYIDPPRNGENDTTLNTNLYNLKVGDMLPNIYPTSTTYENKRNSSAFNQDSQFRGCIFIISLLSSEGAIVIGEHSYFPNEKEVLLDRRGGLYINDIKFEYVVEDCNSSLKYIERMIVYCNFIPHTHNGNKNQNQRVAKILAVDDKEFNTSDYHDDDIVLTEWLGTMRYKDARANNLVAYKPGTFPTICNIIKHMYKLNNDDDDDNGSVVVNTVGGNLILADTFVEWMKIPHEKRQTSYLPNAFPGAPTTLMVGAGMKTKKKLYNYFFF